MSSHHHHLMSVRSGSEEPSGGEALPLNASSTGGFRSNNFNIGVVGEVLHTSQLLDHFSRLLLDEQLSDITLIVEGTRLPAHRLILGARSEYFGSMLFSGIYRESTEPEVTLVDTPLQAFKILLKYVYCGRMQLHSLNFDLVIEVLGLVHKYGFVDLEGEIAEYLKSTLNSRNSCVIYATAHLYSMSGMVGPCLDFIDNYAAEVLSTQGFLQLSSSCIKQLISRNSFCAPEIEIFNAVSKWIDAHPEEAEDFALVLSHIRLSLIKLDDLLNVVRPTGLIDSDKLLDAINEQNKKRSSDLVYRGILCPGMNVAEPAMNAKVLTGEFPTALLLSKKGYSKDHERKFTRHAINAHDPGIIIELGRSFIINHIRLWLLDRDQGNQTFSYYIEVSMDRNDWVRVIDHTQYLCKSLQNLFFHERVVKFIRIVGTHNSLHGTFNLVSLEAMYTTELFEIDPVTTVLVPRQNVATIQASASVIEGVSRSRNALLDGDTEHYDWDDGYTCHQLGSGSITIQFPQPYLLDSLRLRLWDCDDRTYSFYIEVSCDQARWTKIVDVTQRRSWQTLRFQRTPVVFVRIVGTANSANEVFHCVHFETPAQLETIKDSILADKSSLLGQLSAGDNAPSSSTSSASASASLNVAESNRGRNAPNLLMVVDEQEEEEEDEEQRRQQQQLEEALELGEHDAENELDPALILLPVIDEGMEADIMVEEREPEEEE